MLTVSRFQGYRVFRIKVLGFKILDLGIGWRKYVKLTGFGFLCFFVSVIWHIVPRIRRFMLQGLEKQITHRLIKAGSKNNSEGV